MQCGKRRGRLCSFGGKKNKQTLPQTFLCFVFSMFNTGTEILKRREMRFAKVERQEKSSRAVSFFYK